MKGQFKAIAAKTTIWLVAEVILTITGLDNLADYSEFVFERHITLNAIVTTMIVPAQPV